MPVLAQQPAVRWDWIAANADQILQRAQEHLLLTIIPVLLGLLIAFPLSLWAVRRPAVYGPLLAGTGVLFTIPSIALFVLLGPFTGVISRTTAIIGLTTYTLLILVRNIVEGLRGVPEDVRESALAMGYTARRLLLHVELPLAMPVIIAGLRIATVTTIGLATVTAVIGQGGFGRLFMTGYLRFFITPVLVGLVGCITYSVIADLALLSLQRSLMPWTRSHREAR